MSWSVWTGGATVTTGTGSQNVTIPGAPAEDDIVIVATASDQGLITGIQTSGFATAYAAGGSAPGHEVVWKRMTGTPDTTVSYGRSTTRAQAVAIYLVRGAIDTGSPFSGTLQSATGASGSPDPPSHTPADDGALLICVGLLDDDNSAGAASAPSTYGNLAAIDCTGSAGDEGATSLIASKEQASASADNPAAFGGSLNDGWHAITFSLIPGAGTQEADGEALVDLPSLEAGGTATHATPEFGASAGVSIAALSAAGTAAQTFNTSAEGAASMPALVATGEAAWELIFGGSAAISLPSVEVSGEGSHAAPEFGGAGAVYMPGIDATGDAVHVGPQFGGSAGITLGALGAAADGAFSSTFAGSATLSLAGLGAGGTAVHVGPQFGGSAGIILEALAAAGTAAHAAPQFGGASSVVLAALAAGGEASMATVTFDGEAAISIPALSASGNALWSEETGSPSVSGGGKFGRLGLGIDGLS